MTENKRINYLIVLVSLLLIAGCIILWGTDNALWVKLVITFCSVIMPIAMVLHEGMTTIEVSDKYDFDELLRKVGWSKTIWIMFKLGFYNK